MLPLARAILPTARIIAPRGLIDQSGERRWFRKLTPTSFEQESILAEAPFFSRFLDGLAKREQLDEASTLFLGYSNGGNLLHSTMLLHPGRIRRAALLRCMPVLSRAPATDVSGSQLVVLAGDADQTYGPHSSRLVTLLRRRGAGVRSRTVKAGHIFGDQDAAEIRAWLKTIDL